MRAAKTDANQAAIVDRRGKNNNNWRDAGKHVCQHCGSEFKSYVKTRKFCSFDCYVSSKPMPMLRVQLSLKLVKPKIVRAQRESRTIVSTCAHCSNQYEHYQSSKRIYCTYKCHIASGGAFRAGIAASRATMKYGAKKDANHNELFEELRKVCEAVYDLSSHGRGLPDGIAWIKSQWVLFDIKNPKTAYGRRGLNEVQKKWVAQWKGGPVYLIYTADEARRFGAGDFEGIKMFVAGGGQ